MSSESTSQAWIYLLLVYVFIHVAVSIQRFHIFPLKLILTSRSMSYCQSCGRGVRRSPLIPTPTPLQWMQWQVWCRSKLNFISLANPRTLWRCSNHNNPSILYSFSSFFSSSIFFFRFVCSSRKRSGCDGCSELEPQENSLGCLHLCHNHYYDCLNFCHLQSLLIPLNCMSKLCQS